MCISTGNDAYIALERLRPSLLQPDDFTNGDFEDFSPPHSNRGSPTSSSRSLKFVLLSLDLLVDLLTSFLFILDENVYLLLTYLQRMRMIF